MMKFQFPNQSHFYSGKVRDVYTLNNGLLVMIASNRISAFDVILPSPIPYKGQILNQIAAFMLEQTSDICANWLRMVPAPNASIGWQCTPFKIEMVVRGNLTGHAWRTYQTGKRVLCGAPLPEGMKENDFFPFPIITPSTKAAEGHDEDISREHILARELATPEEYAQLESYALQLFERGKEIAAHQGLILADTKYEFGKKDGIIYLIDEVHTPDSSRYFYAEGFETNQQEGKRQKQLSKEFVREWLIRKGFMGKAGQQVPEMDAVWVSTIQQRYVELFEKVTGNTFVPENIEDDELERRIVKALEGLGA